MITRKRCVWRQQRRKPNDQNLTDRYQAVNIECREAIEAYEISLEREVVESKNKGQFFKFISSKMGRKQGVGILKSDAAEILVTDQEKANSLNSFFDSISTIDNGSLPELPHRVEPGIKLEEIEFLPQTLLKIGSKLKSKYSQDPNGHSSFLLKQILPTTAFKNKSIL